MRTNGEMTFSEREAAHAESWPESGGLDPEIVERGYPFADYYGSPLDRKKSSAEARRRAEAQGVTFVLVILILWFGFGILGILANRASYPEGASDPTPNPYQEP